MENNNQTMSGIADNKMIDFLLEGVKKIVEETKNKREWQKLFINTGGFIIQNPDMQDDFAQDIYAIFSETNMKILADKVHDKRGYDFSEVLRSELKIIMARYEIPPMEMETYIHHFIQVVLKYIEEQNTEMNREVFLGELQRNENNSFERILAQLRVIIDTIKNLQKEEIQSYSISDIDTQIRRESGNRRMGLDFFKIDDEQFEGRFCNAINDERIFVVGKSREETVYSILCELKDKYQNRVVLIIKTEKDWDRLLNSDIKGAVLIPFFYAEKIEAITNNTNVFVYGEDEPCYYRDKLELRKRTRKTIIKALEDIGMNAIDAYDMVESTHGLYVPLKKRLFNGAMYCTPDWVHSHSDVIMTALLCGKWTEADGDTLIIEELSGTSIKEFRKELERYLHGENPFIVAVNNFYGESIQLASLEDAWEELDSYISDELWQKFINLFYEVLIESEPIFNYPFGKHFEAGGYTKEPEWSQILKQGMIRTLIMRGYYRGHAENQKQIDEIVVKVLNTISNKERWGYISQYFTDLCEASPESVLRKLESEINEPQGLHELFIDNGDGFFTSRHYYTSILWALEQLVQQKRYVYRAIKLLWELESFSANYNISNSPSSVLGVIFCAWINTCALSVDKKISIAKSAIKRYESAWSVIASLLPQGGGAVCAALNTPRYRRIDEPDSLSVSDIQKTYQEYLTMCVDMAGVDTERWMELFQHLYFYPVPVQREVLTSLVQASERMLDGERTKIKDTLRHELYKHRFFCKASWSLPEDVLDVYERAMNEIRVNDGIYDYLYILSPAHEFPLLHPEPFSKEGKEHEINNQLRESEIREKIKEFKENKYNISLFIDLAIQGKRELLGEIIARFYCNDEYDDDIFSVFLSKDIEGKYVYDYASYLIRGDKVTVKTILKRVRETTNNKTLVVNLLALDILTDISSALISEEDAEIKRAFWSRTGRLNFSEKADKKLFLWALSECKEYGSFKSYMELLYGLRNAISKNELLGALLAIISFEDGEMDSMTSFYIKEILEMLQEESFVNDDNCNNVAQIEWICRNVLDWDQMKCVQTVMKKDPTFYAQLVSVLYKRNKNEEGDDRKRELANRIYAGFDKARFCPSEKDGRVEYDDLKKWIDTFEELLKQQDQDSLFGHLVGRLLPYSPNGEDGFSPSIAVREIIELYYSDSLKSSYIATEKNKRGVYTPDGGKSEQALSLKYKKNAEHLQPKWNKTAEIFFAISDCYKQEAELERRQAEDEW